MFTYEKPQICFVEGSTKSTHFSDDLLQLNSGKEKIKINIFEHFFEYIPKLFKIITKNGSCYFNTEILAETSLIVNEIVKSYNYDQRELYLNINDTNNVLQKVGLLYQGNSVLFDKDDYPILMKILKKLDIKGFPVDLFHKNNKFYIVNIKENQPSIFNATIKISENDLYKYLLSSDKQFILSTKKRDYSCKLLGVFSSEIIRDYFIKNPNSYRYEIDFADELNEFQVIANIFNFQVIEMTIQNIDIINNFAEELQITTILEKIHKYMDEYEKYFQIIDEQTEIVDTIEELFDWLHHIKFLTVEKVKNLILESQWVKTKDNVKELVAFILQTIESEIQLHHLLSDLVIELDKKANDKGTELCIFLPFLVKILMDLFPSKISYCSFAYLLMAKGKIQKNEIIKKLSSILDNFNGDNFLYNENDKFFVELTNILLWFLPEIYELKNSFFRGTFFFYSFSKRDFLKKYIPNKIDLYKKMRDSGEPDDEITKALRNDDVDNFQKLILSNINKISKCVVPFNIYEDYIENGKTNYINYAAAYGAIKCFKYLLLNHIEIDDYTFNYAIYGGNVEIIKIVDQNSTDVVFFEKNQHIINDKIILPIVKHQHELFDWIYEQKYLLKYDSITLHQLLASECASNGNAHALVELINQKIDIENLFDILYYLLQTASKKGFYQMTKLFFKIFQIKLVFMVDNQSIELKPYAPFQLIGYQYDMSNIQNSKYKAPDSFCFESSLCLDNLSIFQLYEPLMNQNSLEIALLFCEKNSLTQIINYFLEKIIKNRFILRQEFLTKFLCSSMTHDDKYLFNFYIDQFKKNMPTFSDEYISDFEILETACEYNHINTVKMITNLILNNHKDKSTKDFTLSLIKAFYSQAFEICKYFFDNKVYIDYFTFSHSTEKYKVINAKILTLILENVPSYYKKILVYNFIQQALNSKSYEAFDILLKNCPPNNNLLFDAVNLRDDELVRIVLKYKSNPSYVNSLIDGKTVLHIAVFNESANIIQLLLSIPGIDVNVIDSYGNSPLKVAYERNYRFIIELLLKNKNVDTNILTCNCNNSILINEIEMNNVKMAELIINHPKTNINANINNKSPLIAAVKNNLTSIVDLLINHKNFDPEESLLDFAFYISSGNMAKLLINVKNLDVNYIKYECSAQINKDIKKLGIYQTTLLNAIKLKEGQKILLIINHPSFDKDKSDLSTAIYYSILYKDIYVFDILLKLSNNHDDVSRAFTISTNELNEFFILNILDFNDQNGHFIDFNKLLPNQKSFFTFIPSSYHNIQKIVHSILENGGDPNIPDGFGVYPLQYAIEINSYEFVFELLNTNKIDFETRINEKRVTNVYKENDLSNLIHFSETVISYHIISYLHLAARSCKKEILSLFLDKNLIDIKIADNLGETPLMEACRHKLVDNIKLLFEKDDLDYLHCNKDGKDALKIILQMFNVDHYNEEINSKDEYLKSIISIIKGNFSKGII